MRVNGWELLLEPCAVALSLQGEQRDVNIAQQVNVNITHALLQSVMRAQADVERLQLAAAAAVAAPASDALARAPSSALAAAATGRPDAAAAAAAVASSSFCLRNALGVAVEVAFSQRLHEAPTDFMLVPGTAGPAARQEVTALEPKLLSQEGGCHLWVRFPENSRVP